MDHAVGLVQAYLHLNGYFTVTEFPVLEALGRDVRASTDLDVLAVRFPGAGRLAPDGRPPGLHDGVQAVWRRVLAARTGDGALPGVRRGLPPL